MPARCALAVSVLAACLGAGAHHWLCAGRRRAGPAVRLDPVSAILDAFASYSVVALGEGAHGNRTGTRLSSGADSRSAVHRFVNDIVVESGSARYQDFMDRSCRARRCRNGCCARCSENTVTPTPAWDRPMYRRDLSRGARLNRSLPRERRLRILLGDPPIDWSAVKNAEDYRQLADAARLASRRPDSARGARQRTTGAGDLRRRPLPGENRTPGPVTRRHPRDRRHQGLQP